MEFIAIYLHSSSCFSGTALGLGNIPPIYPKAWKGSKTILEPITGKCSRLLYVMSCSISDFPSRSPEERLVNRPTFTDVVSSLLIIICCNYQPSAAKKRLFPTSMNDFGLVGIWHLTQLLTTSRGAENLKLYFYRPFIYTFQFYSIFIYHFSIPKCPAIHLAFPDSFPGSVGTEASHFSPVVAQSFGTDGHLSKVVLQQMRDQKLDEATLRAWGKLLEI